MVPRAALAAAALILVLAADAPAQTPAPGSNAPAAQQPQSSDRVAVPEPTDQAIAYHRSGNVLWVLNTVWALALPALLLWTGFSARMRDWARTLGASGSSSSPSTGCSSPSYDGDRPATRLLREFVRQHAYGLSNQTLGKWMSDQVANLGVTLVIGALVLWVPYLLL